MDQAIRTYEITWIFFGVIMILPWIGLIIYSASQIRKGGERMRLKMFVYVSEQGKRTTIVADTDARNAYKSAVAFLAGAEMPTTDLALADSHPAPEGATKGPVMTTK